MTYAYKDIPDKSKEGMDSELSNGMAAIAFYFQSVLGIPYDVFVEDFMPKIETKAQAWMVYMNFRNAHPTLFDK